jgi:hypothetical protein
MEWLSPVHPESLLARLQTLPDPRRRQGRRYPLPAIVGLLVLAAMHGETSVRGMWLWGCVRWDQVWAPLGFWTPQRPPTLTTIWGLLARLDAVALDALLSTWSSGGLGPADGALSVDGKVLRGTRRAGQPARKVVEVVSHERAVVLGQREAPRGDEVAGALALLREVPLTGRVVTMDAGLLQRSVLGVIVAHGGAYLGVLKANQPGVADAVTTWLQAELSPPGPGAAPGERDVDQGARAAGTADLVGGGRGGPGPVSGARVRLARRAAGRLGTPPLATSHRRDVAGRRDPPVDYESPQPPGQPSRTGPAAPGPLDH